MECFSEVEDPRVDRRRRHNLIDLIVIGICAVICNADGWADMRTWAETHQQWLQRFLELPGGLPSRDTLRRTISRIDPDAFQKAFLEWLKGLRKGLGNVVAIDGKTLRGSKVGGKKPMHIVSAWASDNHLTLGQTTVDKKSNEITAIPKLLDTLSLSRAIVTIDAMGCQKDIAAENFSLLRRLAISLIKNNETRKGSIRNKRLRAGYDFEFLLEILNAMAPGI